MDQRRHPHKPFPKGQKEPDQGTGIQGRKQVGQKPGEGNEGGVSKAWMLEREDVRAVSRAVVL